MSKKDLSLEKCGISPNRYRELMYFCLQYKELQESIDYGMNGKRYDAMPRSNSAGTPTEKAAIKNGIALEKCRLIENTAREADARLWEYILQSVTEGTTYEHMDIPAGRRQFYEARKRFFYLLSQKKHNA